jgi:acetyl-CoA decarbonylase/synthase complex subunit gamma
MALKALDIFKNLPKTNCKKCGNPTCLAFAMKLAQKKASLDECPDVSEAGKAALEGASVPPIHLVTIGSDSNSLKIGNETVMFRHEETFYHPPGIAVCIKDDADNIEAAVEKVANLKFHRVGTDIKVDVIAISNTSGDSSKFKAAVEAANSKNLTIVLMSDSTENLAAALEICASNKPLIHAANKNNWEAYAKLAKDYKCPLAVKIDDPENMTELPAKIKNAGVEDLVLDVTADSFSKTLQILTAIRRLSLKKALPGIGYPCMTFTTGDDPYFSVSQAVTYISKYSGIVVTELDEPEHILPMLTTIMNIFTDPRKPIQVEAKLYEIGAVTEESPVLVTTNFSLTYYTVEGEVEASRIPSFICVIDTEGTSVLTAFAADKLTTDSIAAMLNSSKIADKIKHKKVIIPGYVAAMSGGLQEDSGWEVLVGPREASGIPKYLKTVWK